MKGSERQLQKPRRPGRRTGGRGRMEAPRGGGFGRGDYILAKKTAKQSSVNFTEASKTNDERLCFPLSQCLMAVFVIRVDR